ncbi:MAG: hypothetical protein OXF41_05165 [bacterium]|nr:hypothetical protein [bacterium]
MPLGGSTLPTGIAEACDGYATWLQQQPLAGRTRAGYLAQVRQYLQWLGTLDHSEELLPDHTHGSAHIGWGPAARSYEQRKEADLRRVAWAVGDYKGWMLTERRFAPRTVNLALAAIHNFYLSRGLAVPTEPEPVPRQAPKLLRPGTGQSATPRRCHPVSSRPSDHPHPPPHRDPPGGARRPPDRRRGRHPPQR